MSKDYPYIQGERKIVSGVCGVCKKTKPIKRLEWRVDWFQGNCEFEDICPDCLNRRNQRERAEQEVYEKRMMPIWEKQRIRREKRENKIKEIISDLGLSLQKFSNGQWCIGGELDWWTTTGTAIERKSRERHRLSFKDPEKLKEVLSALKEKKDKLNNI